MCEFSLFRAVRPAVGLLVLAGAGCEYPTDGSDAVYVTVATADGVAQSGVLLRGNRMTVRARAWRRTGPADSVEVTNVAIAWASSAPALATVAALANRSAEITGIQSGADPVDIVAVASGFETAAPGVFPLRIADPLEVDSVRPARVRYGDQLTVYGVGIGALLVANLGNAALLADTASFQGSHTGLGSMRFWVPPPASSGRLFAVGPGLFLTAADSTTVSPFDIYEPNDSTPWTLRLDGPPPFPGTPALRVANPALAFEGLRQDTVGFDWYRLTTASPSTAYTIVVDPPGQGGGNRTLLASANNVTGPPRNFTWAVGPGYHACKGVAFAPRAAPANQMVFAFKRLPAQAVDLVSEFLIEGAYSLYIVQGYLTLNPKIGPDRFEENDICDFADANAAVPGLGIDLTTPFSDTLTIDNPYDVDWYRFRVPGPGPRIVTIRVSTPTGAVPVEADGSPVADLGLFLFTAPTPALINAKQTRDESNEVITASLPAGDYYAVVMDQGGAPVRYGLCMALGGACTPPTPVPAFGLAPPRTDLSAWIARARARGTR